MARGSASSPINALRSGLESPFPEQRDATLKIIKRAMSEPTWGARAKTLGVLDKALFNLRRDHPEAFDE